MSLISTTTTTNTTITITIIINSVQEIKRMKYLLDIEQKMILSISLCID